jgi:hypothetical protein
MLFGILLLFKKQIVRLYRSKKTGLAFLILLVLIVVGLFFLNNKYNKEEFDRYPSTFSKREAWQADIARGWKRLNQLTGNGARVAYTGRMEFFPMYGTGLKNEVKYISINNKEITPYNSPNGMIRDIKDFSVWKGNLIREKIDYLFVALPFFDNRESVDPNEFPIEDNWASKHQDNFQLLYKNSLCRIYKVVINKDS